MPRLDHVAPSTTQTVLAYGEPKTGKTELAGNLAKEFNLVWFDLENGYGTLLKLPTEYQKNIELISLPDTKGYPIAIETMLKVITTNKSQSICDTHGKCACPICKRALTNGDQDTSFTEVDVSSLGANTIVVIDSLTQLGTSALSHVLKNQTDLYKPEWEDYRDQGMLLEKILSSIQQARYNVLCLTHVIETKTASGSVKLGPLCGTGSFSSKVAKYFGHVVLLEVKNKKHVVGSSTGFSLQALTGSRTDMELEAGDTLADIFHGKVKNPSARVGSGAGGKVKVKAKVNSTSTSTSDKLAAIRAKLK